MHILAVSLYSTVYHTTATSEIVKALPVTSLTHVSGTIASVQTFSFTTGYLYKSQVVFSLTTNQKGPK